MVTSTVYGKLIPNDYIEYSCGCNGEGLATPLWNEIEVEKLGKHSKCMFRSGAPITVMTFVARSLPARPSVEV